MTTMSQSTIASALLLVGVVLTAHVCVCSARVAGGGDGFSVEFIHRDSVRSPFHDPSLTAHARVLQAARRSTARAAAHSRSYARHRAGAPSADGVVSELTSQPFEYLMAVNVGTPPTRLVAIADTGSDLIWLNCSKGADRPSGMVYAADADAPSPGAGEEVADATAPGAGDEVADAPSPGADDADAPSPGASFDPSNSTTYALVGCDSDACSELSDASCDANSKCRYEYGYGDGSRTSGLLSTETFTFTDGPGDDPTLRVAKVNFGCSTTLEGNFIGDGLVGLGGGDLSLVNQLGEDASLGRRFSYCLVPYSINASSALNFGARADVTDPGAVTTPLVQSRTKAYYTVELRSLKVGSASFAAPRRSTVIVDSGTTLTYLPKALVDPLVKDLTRRIKLPRAQSPEEVLPLCFDVSGVPEKKVAGMIPDVTLGLGGGADVTLKSENTFVEVQEGTVCLAIAAMSEKVPVAIFGNIAQQNMHVVYDLDKGTVTFAPADCASSSPAPGPSDSMQTYV